MRAFMPPKATLLFLTTAVLLATSVDAGALDILQAIGNYIQSQKTATPSPPGNKYGSPTTTPAPTCKDRYGRTVPCATTDAPDTPAPAPTCKDRYGRTVPCATTDAPDTPAPDDDDDNDTPSACASQSKWEQLFSYDKWLSAANCDDGNVDYTSQRRGYAKRCGVKKCSRTKSDGDWQLVLSEDFDGPDYTQPDPAVWDTELGYVRNQELQYYTASPKNLYLRCGSLIIKALNESGNVTSASIYSKQAFTYGRFEARLRVPTGDGIWAAFWLLGIDAATLGWPWCGEIAVAEYLGFAPKEVRAAVQTAARDGFRSNDLVGVADVATANTEFNVYTVDWTPTAVTVFANGVQVLQLLNDRMCRRETWPFDRPFNVKLNLAIGGQLGGQRGVDPSILPAEMQVDYVRVYQRVSPPMCPASCSVQRYYFTAEVPCASVTVASFAQKVTTVPATYQSLHKLIVDTIVSTAKLKDDSGVFIDAIAPYEASTGATRLMVNFTVKTTGIAKIQAIFAAACAFFKLARIAGRTLSAADPVLDWLEKYAGGDWKALSIGPTCSDCFTAKGAPTPMPFQKFQLPAVIPLAAYDYGGESVGYHDVSAWNSLNVSYYRSGPDYVDIANVNNAPIVAYIDALDWLSFSSVTAPACAKGGSGLPYTVKMSLRGVNAFAGPGTAAVRFVPLSSAGDEAVCSTAAICPAALATLPVTGGWTYFADGPQVAVVLTCGTTYRMKVTFPTPYFNLESIRFTI